MGSFTFLGCCGFLLSRFGHDRTKNDSRIEFPSQGYVLPELSPRLFGGVDFLLRAVNCLFCYVYEMVGLWTVLEWE